MCRSVRAKAWLLATFWRDVLCSGSEHRPACALGAHSGTSNWRAFPVVHVRSACIGGAGPWAREAGMERLCELHAAGVSIWLDTLSRHLFACGEFGSLVEDACVTGATSNPTIFAAAIRGADGYEEQLQDLLVTGE